MSYYREILDEVLAEQLASGRANPETEARWRAIVLGVCAAMVGEEQHNADYEAFGFDEGAPIAAEQARRAVEAALGGAGRSEVYAAFEAMGDDFVEAELNRLRESHPLFERRADTDDRDGLEPEPIGPEPDGGQEPLWSSVASWAVCLSADTAGRARDRRYSERFDTSR